MKPSRHLFGVAAVCGLAVAATWTSLHAQDSRQAGYARPAGRSEYVTPTIHRRHCPTGDCPVEYGPACPPGHGDCYGGDCYGGNCQSCPNGCCHGPFCKYTWGAHDTSTLPGKLNAHDRRFRQSLYRGFLKSAKLAFCIPYTVGAAMIPHVSYTPVTPGYIDPRDTGGNVYAAEGYGVPVSVPMAPVVKHQYNYGWGVPSSRLTRINSTYDRMYPNTWYTQAGTPDAAGARAASVSVPTDTTHLGFYGKHVPTWQPPADLLGGTPPAMGVRYSRGGGAAGACKPGMAAGPVASTPILKSAPTPVATPTPAAPVQQGIEVPSP